MYKDNRFAEFALALDDGARIVGVNVVACNLERTAIADESQVVDRVEGMRLAEATKLCRTLSLAYPGESVWSALADGLERVLEVVPRDSK